MPTVLRLGSYRFFFFSNENHEPPHIHVESDNCYAKFWLNPIVLVKSSGYNPKEINKIYKIVTHNTICLVPQ